MRKGNEDVLQVSFPLRFCDKLVILLSPLCELCGKNAWHINLEAKRSAQISLISVISVPMPLTFHNHYFITHSFNIAH
jgi:hypothetical protein